MSRLPLPLLGLAVLLAACASTPTPADPPPLPLPAPAAFKHAVPSPSVAVPDAWWQLFADPTLDALIQRALQHNTDLAAAAARVAVAQAVLAHSQANQRPQLRATASSGRQGGPLVNAAGTEGNLFTAGVQLGYELDLSGRLAATREAAQLDAEAREHLLRAARLMVQAEVAHTYVALRALEAEQQLQQRSLAAAQQQETITQQRLQSGSVPEQVWLARRSQRLQAEANAAALTRRRAELASSLALLLGEPASSFELPTQTAWQSAWQPSAPAIPAGIPSEVLTRRPDVAAALAQWQAAAARRRSAEASAWPSFSLTASGGQASTTLATLARASSRAFGLGALLALPLLDGGRHDADLATAHAQQDEALAQSRRQVLTALKEVEDQLAALQALATQATAHHAASLDATRSAQLTHSRWQHGLASQLDLLDAQQHAWASEVVQLQADTARAQATVGLIRVLGGGWGESPALP